MNEMLTKLKAEVAYLRRLAFETADAYFDSNTSKSVFLYLYHHYNTQLHKVSQLLDNDALQDAIEHVDYVDTYDECDIQYITVEYK